MCASSRDNRSISRIAENVTQSSNFGRNLQIDRNNAEPGVRFKRGEEFLKRDLDPGGTFTEQHCNLQQCDRAQCQRLASSDRTAQHADLFPREFLRLRDPADEYVSIKQQVRDQIKALLTFDERLPTNLTSPQ